MQFPLSAAQQGALAALLEQCPLLLQLHEAIKRQGGQLFLVGGLVRDLVMGKSLGGSDIDVEVHGISLVTLEKILALHGTVNAVGKSFGILKLAGSPIEFAIPRADKTGRKPEVQLQEHMGIREALRRRDVTYNAMAIELGSRILCDPYGGQSDIAARRLRAPDPHFFVQDPLRLYRVMQFCARFAAYPDPALQELCRTMSLEGLSKERIAGEFEKLILQAERPSLGIRWLKDIGRLHEIVPEIAALCGVPQQHDYHPEGDVFEHTMQALDASVPLTHTRNKEEQRMLRFAALCHDLGKPATTELIDGRLRSFGHEIAGVPLAQNLLCRITLSKDLQQAVAVLVRYHMMPGQLIANKASAAAYKRLASNVAPRCTLEQLSILAYADNQGRNGESHEPLTGPVARIDAFIQEAQAAGVFFAPEQAVLVGADLMGCIAPGPALGAALKKAYEIQINRGIRDKEQLKQFVCRL